GHFYNGNTVDFAVQLADECGRLQKTRFDSGEGDLPVERYQILVAMAVALLLIEYLLPSGRSTRRPAGIRGTLRGFALRLRGGRSDAAPEPAGGD
ncbi:MAG: hypothetical protein ACYDCQ_22110, partial [Dehalococcoidia bacterium]